MALLFSSPEVSTVYFNAVNPTRNSKTTNSCQILMKNESFGSRRGVRVRIYSRIEDTGVRVTKLDRSASLYGAFSIQVKSETKKCKEEEEKANYYLNMGYAIRTLREEFPELFYKELSFDIYRDDIVFKDPLNTFTGIENYKSIFWALRFHGKIFFKALWIDIISVWQPVENVVMVRWTVHGVPRMPWESRGRFDATSEYKLDKNGKIYEHRVHNIAMNSPPKFHVHSVEELLQAIGCSSTPKPTYFETSSSSKRN